MSKDKIVMKRYRLRHKITGETIEASGFDLDHACTMAYGKREEVYWIQLPYNRNDDPIKRYVAPIID